jgi:broad specificity phosphatase PhoE
MKKEAPESLPRLHEPDTREVVETAIDLAKRRKGAWEDLLRDPKGARWPGANRNGKD